MIRIAFIVTLLMNTLITVAQKPKVGAKATTPKTIKLISKPTTKPVAKTTIKPKTVTLKPATPKPEPVSVYRPTVKDSMFLKNAANDFCICMAPISDSLHPIAIAFLEESIVIGEKKAEVNFRKVIEKLPISEQGRLFLSIAKLQQINVKDGVFDKCKTAFENKNKNVDLAYNNTKENVYDNLLLFYVKQQCRNAGLLLEMGQKKD